MSAERRHADAHDIDLPETVVVFGGNAKTYHRAMQTPDGVATRCVAAGRNPMEKERAVIETHYSPCSICFPDPDADASDDSASRPAYTCGYPTSRRDGEPCQRPVAHADDRCSHHPRTVLETLDSPGDHQ